MGLKTRFLFPSDRCGFLDVGVLSNERTGLSFLGVDISSLTSYYNPGTDRIENVSSIFACFFIAGDTLCPQDCSLATACLSNCYLEIGLHIWITVRTNNGLKIESSVEFSWKRKWCFHILMFKTFGETHHITAYSSWKARAKCLQLRWHATLPGHPTFIHVFQLLLLSPTKHIMKLYVEYRFFHNKAPLREIHLVIKVIRNLNAGHICSLELSDSRTVIYLRLYSPFAGPWLLFRFFNPIHSR
jgi:hypothetical protein